MSTIPLISHRLYVAAVRSDSGVEVGRGCPHPAADDAQQYKQESRVPEVERRDGDNLVVPVRVAGDWKVRARGDEAADRNTATEAPEVPLEILENSRRPMPSGARRLQSTMRATL